MAKADALDTLECRNCGHTRQVTHQWLEEVSINHNGGNRMWAIDENSFRRLICSQCNQRDAAVKKYPKSNEYTSTGGICPACKGTGGFGKCGKCGGSGYD